MRTFRVQEAADEQEAAGICFIVNGWTAELVKEEPPQREGARSWVCFECADDLLLWESFE